jgi:anti-anti-sigma factor
MSGAAFQTETTALSGIPAAGSIRLAGRVTVDDVSALRKSILDEVERTEATRLVLELSGVERMDTAGAAVLVEALMRGRDRGIRVLLCSPSPSVIQMFRLAGLENVLDYCCGTVEEARRRLLA